MYLLCAPIEVGPKGLAARMYVYTLISAPGGL